MTTHRLGRVLAQTRLLPSARSEERLAGYCPLRPYLREAAQFIEDEVIHLYKHHSGRLASYGGPQMACSVKRELRFLDQ